MRSVDHVVETRLRSTPRVKQLSGMFDVPAREKLRHEWRGEIPIDERPWQIGLLIGPSGSGKSTLLRQLFGEPVKLQWGASSVIDDFGSSYSIEDIANICQAVGFNTIPSWMKPFGVLSTGERFRVEMARQLLEGDKLIAVDEFTSVVDRQVAQIGAHAVQKYIRRQADRQFIAATCHYDVIEWLQPDWMLEPATMTFQWRSVQRRPALNVEISRVDYSAWKLFAPFHYLTDELHRGAACFVLFVEGVPASFAGVLHRPHAKVDDIKGLSRGVTLPDYQGMGLAFALFDTLGAAYKTLGNRLHLYPAHPAFIRSADRSPHWAMTKRPGTYSTRVGRNSSIGVLVSGMSKMGSRPCAVFEYAGPAAASREQARALIQ
jgi:GNAT superfamily N-acetyltransferase